MLNNMIQSHYTTSRAQDQCRQSYYLTVKRWMLVILRQRVTSDSFGRSLERQLIAPLHESRINLKPIAFTIPSTQDHSRTKYFLFLNN